MKNSSTNFSNSSEGFRKGMTIDPLRMEILKNAFISITEEMSATLHRSAYSTNIKTRKDYTCTLFDKNLRVVAQSFSQPSHLGVIRGLVRKAVETTSKRAIKEGDVIITNDPYHGAGHLNDIALITPIFTRNTLYGFVGNMAHHVDVGGGAPASMFISKELYQEGIIIPPIKLYSEGVMNEDLLVFLTRNIRAKREVPGDIRAQIAANNTGLRRFNELIARYDTETIDSYTEEIIAYSKRRTLEAFNSLPQGEYSAEDFLDDDGFSSDPIKIRVKVIIDQNGIVCDFTGTDAQRKSPMNATTAFTFTAVSFVLKCLIDDDIPVNDGFYQCIRIRAPKGTVVNCSEPSGVVGGYEVAERVVNSIFRALSTAIPHKVMACTKGTIAHLGFGGYDTTREEGFAFLETIGGGFGGRLGRDGIEAVQCDLSNTENAPVEEMEINYPVRLLRYELIPDSGGAGKWRGGLGIKREYQFTNPSSTTVTIFADRSKFSPWGISRGKDGKGAAFFLNPSGETKKRLSSKCVFDVLPDDIVSFQTPGGGGYGDPFERDLSLVSRDVQQGKLSKEKAIKDYGVVIDEDGVVDHVATRTLREGRTTYQETR